MLIAALLVLVAVAAGVWWLSRNLDDIAKNAIQNYASAMTQAPVKVGAVQLAPTHGRGSIHDLRVGNPKGFKTAHALQVRNIAAYIGESAPSGSRSGKTVDINLPDIALKDIGRAQGGVTPGELGGIVTNAIRARLTASFNFDRLLQSGSQVLDKAGATIKGWFGK